MDIAFDPPRSGADLAARLARLERVERRRSLVTLALGLSLAAGVAGGFARQEPEILEVHELRIVDTSGRTVLIASADEAGNGYLELANGANVPVCFLGTVAGHGALDLLNDQGQRAVFAGCNAEGDGGVRTENEDGTRAFYMGDDVRDNGRVPGSSQPGGRVGNW
jgi:hypothetical protein